MCVRCKHFRGYTIYTLAVVYVLAASQYLSITHIYTLAILFPLAYYYSITSSNKHTRRPNIISIIHALVYRIKEKEEHPQDAEEANNVHVKIKV